MFTAYAAVVCCSLRLLATTAQSAPPEVRCLALPIQVHEPVIDPSTGMLYGVGNEGSIVGIGRKFFDGDLSQQPLTRKLPKAIVQLQVQAIKGGSVLLAMPNDGSQVFILNPADLSDRSIVQIGGESEDRLAAMPSGESVLVIGRFRKQSNMSVYGSRSFNVETGAISEVLTSNGMSQTGRAIVAPTGALYVLHYNECHMSWPIGAGGAYATCGRADLSREGGGGGGTSALVVGPAGRFVAAGSSVFPPGLSGTPLATLPFRVTAASTTRAALFGVAESSVHAASSSTFKPLGAVDLQGLAVASPEPGESVKRVPRPRPPSEFRNVQYMIVDDGAARVIVLGEGVAAVVPFEALNVTAEAPLGVLVEGSPSVDIGAEGRVRLKPITAGSKVELAPGQQGATLDKDELRWKPRPDQVGPTEVTLRITAAGVSVDQPVRFEAAAPRIILPFTATGIAISDDGAAAFIWEGTRFGDSSRDRQASRFALAQGSASPTVSSATPQRIALGHLDSRFAYIVPEGASLFSACSLKDLSETKKVFTHSQVQAMRTVGDVLFVHTQEGIEAYHLPDLTVIKSDEIGAGIHGPTSQPGREGLAQLPLPIPEGWDLDGCIYDSSLKTLRLLSLAPAQRVSMWVVREMTRVPASYSDDSMPREDSGRLLRWGVLVTSSGVQNERGQTRVPFAGEADHPWGAEQALAVLRESPVAARLEARIEGGNDGRRQPMHRTGIMFFSLATGEKIAEMPLANEPPLENGGNNNGTLALAVSGGCFAALDSRSGRAYMGKIPAGASGARPPLRFKPEQSAFVAASSGATRLTHAATPANGLVYDMVAPQPWMSINATTGEVTLDIAAAMPSIISGLIEGGLHDGFYGGGQPMPPDPAAWADETIAKYKARTDRLFERAAGKAPSGVAVIVPIAVNVRDASNETATLRYGVLADVSTSVVREAAIKRRQEMQKSVPPPGPVIPAESADLRAEMMALRARVDQLEGKINLLMDLLQRREGAPQPPAPQQTQPK